MNARKKWLRFDLHMHTFRSDGFSSTKRMLMTAKNRGLDVVAITDHNVSSELSHKEALDKYGIYTIPGFELSFLRGHILVLGVDPLLADDKLEELKIRQKKTRVKTRKKNIRKILKYFIDQGALIIAAHPKIPTGTMSLKGTFLAELYDEGLLHGAEIHNGDLERKFRKKLYRVWHRRAKKAVENLGMPAYSNSDSHFWWRIGTRFNMVELDDPKNLLEELKKGKIEIKHGTKSDL
jgi:predicted metal-dependent phosphoesterase TrpH